MDNNNAFLHCYLDEEIPLSPTQGCTTPKVQV